MSRARAEVEFGRCREEALRGLPMDEDELRAFAGLLARQIVRDDERRKPTPQLPLPEAD